MAPPATVKIASHSVGAVFVEASAEGKIEFLAHYYTSLPQPVDHPLKSTLRFPAGTAEPVETVRDTLVREIDEEVAASHGSLTFRYLNEMPIYSEVVRDDTTRQPNFVKLFFAVVIASGNYRRFSRIDQPGAAKEELHEPLLWWEVGDLLDEMLEFGSPRSHPAAAGATLAFIAQGDPVVRARYPNVLGSYRPHVIPAEVSDYLGRA